MSDKFSKLLGDLIEAIREEQPSVRESGSPHGRQQAVASVLTAFLFLRGNTNGRIWVSDGHIIIHPDGKDVQVVSNQVAYHWHDAMHRWRWGDNDSPPTLLEFLQHLLEETAPPGLKLAW